MNIHRGFSRYIRRPQHGLQSYVETEEESYDELPCFGVVHPLVFSMDLVTLGIDSELGDYYCSVHPCRGDAYNEDEHCWGVKT